MRTCHVESGPYSTPMPEPLKPEKPLDDGAEPGALVARVARTRDRAAFVALFRHFAPRLNSYFLRLGASAHDAEELVQEAMTTLWLRASSYRPERAAVSTWVFTIARNLSVDRRRRERHFEPHSDIEGTVADEHASAETGARHSERQRRLARAARALPPEQVEVLNMHYFKWQTTREIAETTGLSEGTVKSRLRLAISRLRAFLKEA